MSNFAFILISILAIPVSNVSAQVNVSTPSSIRVHHFVIRGETAPKILRDLAKTAASLPPADITHRAALCDAAKALHLALKADPDESQDIDDIAHMTPAEEVLLLHVLE